MLKTDYQDDMFTGSRKYSMVTNEDKTISLIDMTEYTQEGDQFGSNDINTTNREVNRLGNMVTVSLPAARWSSEAPYSLKVAVSGIKGTDVVKVFPYTPRELDSASVKLRRKLTGMLTDVESEDGYAVFYCGEKKPTADFTVMLEGVSKEANENG